MSTLISIIGKLFNCLNSMTFTDTSTFSLLSLLIVMAVVNIVLDFVFGFGKRKLSSATGKIGTSNGGRK